MAGLTREQRAAKAAAESQSDLVPMYKDGETTYVHSTCVQSHKDAGWKVVND